MNNSDLFKLFSDEPMPVTVVANDYSYEGWVIMVGRKRSGEVRCAVEDRNGRLFVHNATQLRRGHDG